jgi:hypothetical protein
LDAKPNDNGQHPDSITDPSHDGESSGQSKQPQSGSNNNYDSHEQNQNKGLNSNGRPTTSGQPKGKPDNYRTLPSNAKGGSGIYLLSLSSL